MDRLIHQMWDKEPIPEELLKWRETWTKYHPGWTFTFWNLDEMHLFLEKKYNWFYKTFTEYPTLIQKIDSISNKKSYEIKEVAKMYNSKIKYLKARPRERYAAALTKISLNNKIIRRFGKIKLKDYITSFIKSKKKNL